MEKLKPKAKKEPIRKLIMTYENDGELPTVDFIGKWTGQHIQKVGRMAIKGYKKWTLAQRREKENG